jgi:hypothetical protein
MMVFKKSMPRRSFLRGAGVAMALPFLDAMVPAFAKGIPNQPLRLGYIYLPVGRIMANWTPATTGENFELTPTLEPLAAFREQMLVLSGLDIKAAHLKPGERGGPHARPCAAFLTGVHPYDNSVGISVDQVIARDIGRHTQLASLELGLDPAEWAGGNEADYDGFYRSTISWRTATTPLPTQNNPRKVFERMFGDTDTVDPEAMRLRIARQSSVLDSINGRVNRLMAAVGANDRYKLEEYLDAVRDVERGIQVAESRAESGEGFVEETIQRPAGIPASYETHAKLIFDLMFLAYQANLSHVVSFMMGHEGTNRNYLELGAQDGHHSMSHHKGEKNTVELLKKVDRYQSELVAYFLKKMRSASDGEGTLLDNTLLVVGSALSDANLHIHTDVPIVLVGGAQGRIKGGRHIRYNSEPLSNLHLAVLDMFGVSAEEYVSSETSDATGILKGLV